MLSLNTDAYANFVMMSCRYVKMCLRFSTSVLFKGVLKATLNDYNVSLGIFSES